MTQKQVKGEAIQLIPVDDVATAWGVTPRTINNWCEFIYQGFEIMLPSSGPFPAWAVDLLNLCAKHISEKSSLYFAETGEKRRLKGSEFIAKIRRLRSEGHFQQFQQFQQFQNFSNFQETADELENELLAEVGELTRTAETRIGQMKEAIEQREDQQIEELAQFVEDSDRRKLGKLKQRLQSSKLLRDVQPARPSISDAIDVAYRRLPE